MIRFIFFAIVIALVANLIKNVIHFSKNNACENCDGKGFWRETRGDRVFCKKCDGRGFIPKG